jgi:hypothetical protein
MEKCIICGRDISKDKHFLIESRGREIHFYSQDCAKKFIENEESLLNINTKLNNQINAHDEIAGLLNSKIKKNKIDIALHIEKLTL